MNRLHKSSTSRNSAYDESVNNKEAAHAAAYTTGELAHRLREHGFTHHRAARPQDTAKDAGATP